MGKRYKVLIVDDSAFTRRMISSLLVDTEFDVVAEAASGGAAVNEVKTRKPDLVLLDVIMPDRNGTLVLKDIVDMEPDMRVVMLSSMGTEEVVGECLSLGARSFIQKPCDKETLITHMRKIVNA